jgi:hypothetical protein
MPKGRNPPTRETSSKVRARRDFSEPGLPSDKDERHNRLLEYIAHYLEGIEIQLERIANSIESGKVNEPVQKAISNLEGMLMILNQTKD